MLKKNFLPIFTLLILISIAAYFYFTKNKSTLKNDEFNYKVADSASIQRIIIANAKDTFSLNRGANAWIIQDQFLANKAMLNLCFRVLKESEIQSVLSSDLAKQARKLLLNSPLVTIVLNNGTEIQFYILANKPAQQVWMMLKESQKAFVVNLPSYKGNFAALFYTKSIDWRENTISLDVSHMQSWVVAHPKNRAQSFAINFTNNKIELIDNTQKPIHFSKESLEQYLFGIRNIQLSKFIFNENSVDSLKRQTPYAVITYTDKNNIKSTFQLYPKGKPADLNEAYILLNNKDMAVVKYINIDPLLPEIDVFRN